MKLTGPWFRSLTIAAVMTGLAVISTCSINKVGLGAKVDITPPKLAITSPSSNGQYLSGAITFSGTASDDIGVTALTLSYAKASGGSAVLPLTLTDGGWSLTVPSNTPDGLAEGKQTIEVSGTDASGKTVTDSVLIYVDNTAPTVMVTYPLTYGTTAPLTDPPQTTSTIDVKGEIADASPITSVIVTLENSSGGVISTTDALHNPNPKTANGTNTWSTRFYLKDVVSSGVTTIGKLNVTDGSVYHYTVTATDAAGNTNSWYYHVYDIALLPATGTPTPSVEEIATIDHAASGTISTPSSISSNALEAKRLGIGTTPVWGNFKYVESSAPTINFSNIDATGGVGQNLLSPGSVITGNIIPQQGSQQIDPASFVATIYESTLPSPVATFTASSIPAATLTTLGDSVAFIIPLKNNSGVALLPDQYHMTISAQGTGSDPASTTVAFFIDSGAPSLNVNTVPSYVNAPFAFSGTATATVGLKEIDVYETVNGVPSSTPVVINLSGTTQSWTSPTFPITPADGGYDYELRLIASTGSTSSIYKSINYDATKPVVVFNSVTPVIGTSNVNGLVTFSSSVTDANALSAVKWGLLPTATACPSWNDANWKTFASAPYSQTFDSSTTDMYGTATVDNSDYKIWVIAQDKAGNQTSASTPIHIMQSSDNPTITLTNLDSTTTSLPTPLSTLTNVLGVGPKVVGTLGDDDAIDTSSAQIEVDGGSWTNLTTSGTTVAQSFSYDLSALADGLHTLSIRVSDLASAKNGKPAVTTTLPPVYFAIDRLPPTLAVTSPSSGSLLNSANVTISGTASAANGLAGTDASGDVVISNGATTIATAPVVSGAWTTTVNSVGEGLHSWTAKATGVFGTTTTLPVTFSVDTVPPTGTIGVPSSTLTWYSGSTLSISGTASDAGAVAKVEWSLDGGTTWTTATGTNSWNASIPLATEGIQSLSIRLTDTAGNQTLLTRGFGVDVAPPTLTEVGVAGAGSASQSNVIANKSGAYTLSGSLGDSNQLQTLTVTESKNGGAAVDVTTTTTPTLGATVKSATWATVSLPLGGLASGTYTYVITVTDVAGKQTVFNRTVMIDLQPPAVSISQPTAGSPLQGSLFSIRGNALDNVGGSGTSEIYYIVTASTASEPSGTTGWTGFVASDGAWSSSIDLSALSEGSKKLWVRAQDAAGNVTADGQAANVTFFIDQSPPTLTATTSPAATAGIETVNYAFQGTVSDTDALAATHPLTVSIDGGAATDIVPTGSTWTYPVTTEGLHSYVFTATDIVGKTTQAISTITLDKTAPNVSVSTPSANQWFASPSVTIQGIADDGTGSGVQSVRWATTAAGQPQPADPTSWLIATGTSTWSTSISLTSEGKQTLWYAAIDKAGWLSTVKSVDFGYDLAPPTLTETTVPSQAHLNFSLSGTASDSDALASPDFLTLSVDYGVAIPLASLSAPYVGTYNSGTKVWTITVNPDLVTHTMDGTHIYQLVATDIAGKTTTLNRTVVIDTTPPTATISTPTSGSWTVAAGLPAIVTVSGTANDGSGSGVSKIYYKAADSGDGTPAGDDPTTWALAGGTTANWTGSVSIGTEGQKTLWVKALDSAGNVMTTATQLTFGVDDQPPTLTASGTTTLVSSSTAVVLSGTYADSLGVANLSLSLEVDGVLKPSPGFVTGAGTDSTNGVWSLTIPAPADHSNDGTHSYGVVVKDLSLQTTKVIRNITIDTQAPTVSAVSTPAAGSWINGATYSLQGTATDASGSGVASVWYILDAATGTDHSSEAYNAAGWSQATGTTAWSANITLSTYGEGPKKLYVKAVDAAGNATTTAFVVAFGIDQTPPSLSESSIAGVGAASAASFTGSANTTFSLQGSIADTDQLTALTVTESANGGANQAVTLAAPATVTGTSQTWTSQSLPLGGAVSGSYVYTITVTDLAGKTTQITRTVTIDKTPPDVLTITSPVSASLLQGTIASISGTSNDTAVGSTGVATIYYTFTNSLASEPSGTAGWSSFAASDGAWNTTINLTTVGEGSKILWVRAMDKAGNVTPDGSAAQVAFFIDQTPPTLTETGIGTGALTTEPAVFDFTGVVSDTDALATTTPLTVSQDGGAATTIVPSGSSWTYHVTSAIGEGQHTYVFTATDIAGRTTQVTRTVILDTIPPTASITSPIASQWLSGSTFTLKGVADDGVGSGVASVYYKVTTGADPSTEFAAGTFPSALNGWTAATGTISWQSVWSLASEGNAVLWVGAIDKAGHKSTTLAQVAFGVDQNPPTLTEVSPASQTKIADFSFSGTVADSNALSATVPLTVAIDGGSAVTMSSVNTTYPQWTGTLSSGAWSLTATTASHSLDGAHTLVFTATDVAGRTTPLTRNVVIDTQAPTLVVNSPSAGLTTNATSLTISGSANDGSGTGVAAVWYKVNNGADASSETPAVPNGWTKATGTNSWSSSITGLTEGAQTLWLKAIDTAGNVTSATDAAATKLAFTVDLTPPVLGETTIGASSVQRSAFTFGGAGTASAATDALSGVQKLVVADNGGTPSTVTVTSGNWSLLVPVDTATHANDGSHTYVFTLTDNAGNTTSLTRTVTIDSTPATVNVTAPVSGLFTNSLSLPLSGSANDGAGTGVSQVWYLINDGSAPTTPPSVPNGWTQAGGTPTNWSATGTISGSDGAKKVWVSALDNAGNWSIATTVDLVLDRVAPTLSETTMGATSKANAAFSFGATATGAIDAVSGVKSFTVTDNGGSPTALTAGNTWSFPVAVDTATHANDGSHTYVFTLTDNAGNTTTLTRTVTIDSTPATVNVTAPVSGLFTNSLSLPLSGSANDGAGTGVSQVWYLINDGSAPTTPPSVPNGWTQAGGTPTNWSATGTISGSDGAKKVWVSALDNAGNWSIATTVDLVLDRVAPTLSETTMGATSKANAAFSFGATATGAIDAVSGVKSFTVTDNGGSPTALTAGNTWSFPVAVDTATHANDGSHTYVFTLTDNAGNTTTLTRTVTIDSTPATVNVTAPVSGLFTNSLSLPLSGSANDGAGTGVSQVWYLINDGSAPTTPPSVPNGWTQAGGTPTNWSATGTISGSDGAKKVWVSALDNAGNWSTSTTVDLVLDRVAPTLSETTMGATSKANAAFSFGATATGAIDAVSGVKSFTVTDNGGSPTALTAGNTWSFPVAVDTATHANDGSHTYVFTLTDNAGNTTTLTRTVSIDTIPASVTVTAPVDSTFVNTTSLTISGSANDAAGTGVSQIWFIADQAATSHSADSASTITSTWTKATGTTNWTATGSLPTGDGAKKLWVVVLDNAGNWSVPASVALTLDTTPPVLNETNLGSTPLPQKTSFTLGATTTGATDALSGIKTLIVTDNGNAPTSVTVASGSWAFPVTVDTTGHTSDGNHSYVFTLTDNAGNTSTLTRTVTIDTTPATATVTSPTAAGWVNSATPTISGTANDGSGSGVTEVWYIVDDAANDHTADAYAVAGWTKAATTSPWSAALSGLTEGNKKLTIKTLDKAGNFNDASTATVVSFGVDLTAPTVSITNTGAYKTPFVISGTSADPGTTPSGVSTLQYKIDSAPLAPLVWGTTNISSTDFTNLSEGPHTLTVIATDAAGNQTTQSASFNKDTTAPTVAYSNIQSGGVFQDTAAIIKGTLTDASGIDSNTFKPTYSLSSYNYATASWTVIQTASQLKSNFASIAASPTNFSWTIDLSATGLNLPDGQYEIQVTSQDIAGNASTSTFIPFFVSRANPTVTVSSPALGTFQSAAFPVEGLAFEYNSVNSVVAKAASGTVDFTSGTTPALPALATTATVGNPGTFATSAATTLQIGDVVYIYGSPMPNITVNGVTSAMLARTPYTINSVSGDHRSFTLNDGASHTVKVNASTATNLVVASSTRFSFVPTPQSVTVAGTADLATTPLPTVGQMVNFIGGQVPAGLSGSATYYVISVNSGSGTFQISTSPSGSAVTPTGSGTISMVSPVTWLIPSLLLGSLSDGPQTVYIQASSANSGKAAVTSQAFTLDTTPPTISVTSPPLNAKIVGNLSILGSSNDPGTNPSGVSSSFGLRYAVGLSQNPGTNPTPSWTTATGGAYSWSISLTAATLANYAGTADTTQVDLSGAPSSTSGFWQLPLYLQTQDNAGKVTNQTFTVILDPNGNIPAVSLTSPLTSGAAFGGQVRISGTATQPIWVHDVQVAVDTAGGQNFPSTDSNVVISGSSITETATASNNLTVKAKYTIAFPGTTDFTTLGAANNNVGTTFVATGSVAGTGTAYWTPSIGQMVYFSGAVAPVIGATSVPATTPFYVLSAGSGNMTVSATSGGGVTTFSNGGTTVVVSVWGAASLINGASNSVNWYYDINTLNQFPQTWNGYSTSQPVTVQARAWNSATVGGSRGTIWGEMPSALSMNFNSSFPKFANFTVGNSATQAQSVSYTNSMTTSGTIYVWGTLSSSKGLSKVERVEETLSSQVTQLYPNTATSNLSTAFTVDQSAALPWAKTTVTPQNESTQGSFPVGSTVMITSVGTGTWSNAGLGVGITPQPGVFFITTNNGSTMGGSGGAVMLVDGSGNVNYSFTLQIDSTQFLDTSAGTYSFDLRLTDLTTGSPQVATNTYTVKVDNYSPTSSGTTGATNMLVTLNSSVFSTSSTNGLANGNIVYLNGTNLPTVSTGYVNVSVPYFVVNNGAFGTNTFELSTTSGGAAVSFTSNILSNTTSSYLAVTRSNVPQSISGTVWLSGVATDFSPTVSIGSLQRIVAYLDKGGTVAKLTSTGLGTNGTITAKDMTTGNVSSSILFPANLIVASGSLTAGHQYKIINPGSTNWTTIGASNNSSGTLFTATGSSAGGTAIDYTVASTYAASIDVFGQNGVMNSDGWNETSVSDPYLPNSTDWGFQLNTSNLADGSYTLHYVIFDSAGNATHYSQAIFISNHAPIVSGVQLGTDVNGDGSINAATVPTGEVNANNNSLNTGFMVRNNLLSILTTTSYDGSNSALNYKVEYNNAGSWITYANTATSSPAFGGTYNGVSITNTGGIYHIGETLTLNWKGSGFANIPDVAANGAQFRVTLTDATGQSVVYYFNTGVQNIDTVPPTITLAAFGQRYTTPTDAFNGGVNTDSGKALTGVTAYTDNIKVSDGSDGYTSGTLEGHVEYAANSVFADTQPNLSGKVTFRGKAADDQRISLITATIGTAGVGYNSGVEFPVAYWSGNGLTGLSSGTDWSFAVEAQSVSPADGHALNWAFTWDTSKVTNYANKNVKVTFKVYDFNNSPSGTGATRGSTTAVSSNALKSLTIPTGTPIYLFGGATPTSTRVSTYNSGTGSITLANAVPTDNTSYILGVTNTASDFMTVDIVPYITKLVTGLSSAYRNDASVFNRTLTGRYPVAEGKTVEIMGFNFNGTANTTVSINGTTVTTGNLALGTTNPNPANTDIIATLNSTLNLTSGLLKMSVNSIDSINNANTNSLSWNQEPNNTNNNAAASGSSTATNLTDDRYLEIWKFASPTGQDTTTLTRLAYPQFKPVKTVSGTTIALGVAYADADSYFRMVQFPVSTGTISDWGTSAFEYGYTRFYMPTFDTDTSGQFYGMAINEDHSSDSWYGSTHVSYFAIAPGTSSTGNSGQNLNAVHAKSNTSGFAGAYDWGTNKRGLEHNYNVNFATPTTSSFFNSQRTENPDTFVTGAAGAANNYLVYYDQTTDQVKFRYMKITGTESANSNPGPWTTFDGNAMRDVFTGDANGSEPDFEVVGVSGVNSGPYATIGAWYDPSLTREVAFIAWYDQKNQVLRYSYNDNPTLSAQSSQWATHTITLDNSFAGQYVKLAVDGKGGIHLAYYSNSGGDLKYAYIKDYKNAATTSTIVTVDSYLTVGTNVGISVVTNGTVVTPYISYYLSSFDQTSYSLRYAYINGGFDSSTYVANSTITNAVDSTTDGFKNVGSTKWEVGSVPTPNVPKSYQISSTQIGTSTAPTFYLGYVTTANLEYAYRK